MCRRRIAAAFAAAALAAPALAQAGAVAGTWERLPPAPGHPTEGLSVVWTGHELVLFGRAVRKAADGGVLGRTDVADAYDPGTRHWQRLPPPPATTGFLETTAVWTGKEVLVWGQGTRLAYTPATNRWRRLPGSRLLSVHDGFGLVAWTGTELVGWGGGCCGDAFSDGIAFEPRTNRWHALPRAPLAGAQRPIGAWTGHELVVLVGSRDPDGHPWPARFARAAAYDPATNRWRRIAPIPAERPGATAAWDGREVVVAGGTARAGFAFDPVRDTWRRLPALPSTREQALARWTGRELVLWGGSRSDAVALRRGAVRWSAIPPAPVRWRPGPAAAAAVAWNGRVVVVAGGNAAALTLAR